MAFLPDVDDDWAFDAALSFVDDYSLDALSPTSTPPIASSTSGLLWPSSELPHVKHEPMPAALNEGPTFTVACKEASAMVPISMKSLMSGSRSLSSGLQLSLPTADASPTKPKSTKAKKTPTNPNRVRDEAQYEVAYLREKVAELELQLRKLQLHATPSSTIDFLAAMSVQRPFAQVPRMWKEIATRQRRRRDEAQRENVRLRLMAERKRKMATGLSALLRKRLTQQVPCFSTVCGWWCPQFSLCVLFVDREPNAHVAKVKFVPNVERLVYLTSKAISETFTTFSSTSRARITKLTPCLQLVD
ncbi:hypothetical protein PF002_g3183 [Phytophthora fragariae]|uniref:Uncharacterized protein n=1 Tax=Phytophthora fragariae TaxID=53985 RepID=A0A6A4ABI2_9STRA|nr:hypothetical protein PF002_g3183 [Phytophthora fragariae]